MLYHAMTKSDLHFTYSPYELIPYKEAQCNLQMIDGEEAKKLFLQWELHLEHLSNKRRINYHEIEDHKITGYLHQKAGETS